MFALLAVGHTLASKSFMSDPQFKGLPRHVGAFSRAGWYQGALSDPIEKGIAALTSILCFGTSAWYNKNGIRDTAAVVGFAGMVQSYAAFLSKA
ncbi:hypothetical protein RJZ56_005087 [Blastomyces dermatitidis]